MEPPPSAAATGYDYTTAVAAVAYSSSSSSSTGHRLGGGGGNPGTSSSTDNMAVVEVVDREHMFDKVVTPSDVGKLNRLVIPKQHAEKYFPLDSSISDKGLLLNFEDGNGKPWRFRYSYWNSSQSYVITKGWSRFVKDKKLDAGDIVSFQRGVGDSAKHRLFIDWKRRRIDLTPPPLPPLSHLPDQLHYFSSVHPAWNNNNYSSNNNPLFLQPLSAGDHSHLPLHPTGPHFQPRYYYSAGNGGPYDGGGSGYNPSLGVVNPSWGSAIYFGSATGAVPGSGEEPNRRVFESVPVVQLEKVKAKAAAAAGAKRRLRLFGVNMDCPVSSDEEEDECNMILSSTTVAYHPTFKTAPHLSNSLPPI